MRAFVTIIYDAFRETMVSKTLWVLLGLATLFLLALAPLSIEERGPHRFDTQDLRDEDGLIREINRERKGERPSPGKRIAEIDAENSPKPGDVAADTNVGIIAAPEPDDEDGTSEPKPGTAFPFSGNVTASLNEVVKSPKLYDREAWSGIAIGEEAETLLARGADSLEEKELGRLNRLLIEAAYERYLNVAKTKSYLGYATWTLDQPFENKATFIAPALTFFTDNILGVVGVFIAILVTSTFVPRTFEPGAIDLLLSKPVSRSLVFLAKFVGGCLFVLLLSAYVIVGLYLIAGLRLGYWNHRFLYCIPLLFFLFAIYYSVSAMAGVIWRNAIVSVVVAMVFWAMCFALGATKAIFDAQVMTAHRIYWMTEAGDETFAAFRGAWGMPHGGFKRWDEGANNWVEALANSDGGSVIAPPWENRFDAMPVYDPTTKRLLAVGNLYDRSGEQTGPWLFVARPENNWRQEILGKLPQLVRQLIVRGDGKVLALASGGILEITATPTPLSAEQLQDKASLPALECPVYEAEDWAIPSAAAAVGKSSDLIVYDPGRLRRLRLVDGKRYEAVANYHVEPAENCHIDALACGGDRVVLALGDRRILVFALKDNAFELLAEHEASSDETGVRQVRITPDGKAFAIRRDDQRVFWYDTDADAKSSGRALTGGAQGNVTSITMSDDGHLAAAYAFNHLLVLDGDGEVESRVTPDYTTPEKIYWYAVKPFYMVFPKPGELGNVTAYFLYGKETVSVPGNPEAPEEKLDIYTPIWSNLAFLAVMLGAGCWYVSRRDF